jgi:hypothetical protein
MESCNERVQAARRSTSMEVFRRPTSHTALPQHSCLHWIFSLRACFSHLFWDRAERLSISIHRPCGRSELLT